MLIWASFLIEFLRKLLFLLFFVVQVDVLLTDLSPLPLYYFLSVVFLGELVVLLFNLLQEIQTPDKPDDSIQSDSGSFVLKSGVEVSWVTSSLRGWRPHMEDAHVSVEVHDGCVFGVFDGHGGKSVAIMAVKLLPALLKKHAELVPKDRLSSCIIDLDETLWKGPFPVKVPLILHPYATVGSTCVLCHVNEDCSKATVASTGDSRAILSKNRKSIALSEDHKPEDPEEKKRIEGAGGRVTRMGPCFRIDGCLNLSRALGDFKMKREKAYSSDQQRVICHPSVREHQLSSDDDFLLLACDGLFEKFTRQDAVDVVNKARRTIVKSEPKPWKDCASELAIKALAKHGMEAGLDNETATIITWKSPERE